jgi:hypothetical protein
MLGNFFSASGNGIRDAARKQEMWGDRDALTASLHQLRHFSV